MKPGRNEPCPCGSGKKFKHCCKNIVSVQHEEVMDEVEQVVAMNPNLSLDGLNLVLQQRMATRNNQPNPDFFGLSPNQMANWLYAPFSELSWVHIRTPKDLSISPVMSYLALILDEAIANNGSFKATNKGNLPTKIVQLASDLEPKFVADKHRTHISISEFAGANEGKFNALHYTRVLAEIAGIIYRRAGRFHVKKVAQKKYASGGIYEFYLPMLEAAVTRFNWGYFDSWEDHGHLRSFWLFMIWRLQSHGSIEQLTSDVAKAFPDFLRELETDPYFTPNQVLNFIIKTRFVTRFCQYWGFLAIAPCRLLSERTSKLDLSPLFSKTFQFQL